MFKNQKKLVQSMYNVGETVELEYMDDPYAPPMGTKGTITSIDDIGQIHVDWENGSSLALVYGVDKFKVIK